MARTLLAVCIALLLSLPARADDWFRPPVSGPGIVNPDLTAARALRHEARTDWDGQVVLWEGRLGSHVLQGSAHRLLLRTPAGDVPVIYRRKALNLEYDRTGYRVAVKGRIRVRDGRVQEIEGLSMILLDTPAVWDYGSYRAGSPPDLASFLAWWIGFHNPEVPPDHVATLAAALVREARANGLDPLFLASLVQVESAFDEDAVSSSGAIGLGQLMPFTAEGLGVDPRDPEQNIAGAARMLAGLVRDWEGAAHPWVPALASYNAGPNLLRRLGGQVPAIPQTANYVYFIGFVHQSMSRTAQRWGVPVAEPLGNRAQESGPQGH